LTAHSDAIIRALRWLELDIDGPPRFQSSRRLQHVEIAEQLLKSGGAYRCYCTTEELEKMRAEQLARGESPRYDRRWRDSDNKPPVGISSVIRLKTPLTGESHFVDAVKGDMRIDNTELDDLVLLRADGQPTYNLANVADDIDEGMTHVVRGDDHVMNTFRQLHIYAALGKSPPVFAHLPMILSIVKDMDGNEVLGEDGSVRYERMSKRNAAVDVGQYEREGFLPEALINYLARLSWSCGDAEIFDRDFLVKNFNFAAVQRSPARFDMEKLRWINREYVRVLPPSILRKGELATVSEEVIALALPRVDTLADVPAEVSYFMTRPTPTFDMLTAHCGNKELLQELNSRLATLPEWNAEAIKQVVKQTAKDNKVKFPQIGMPMRVLLTGRTNSPDIAVVAALLGRDESLSRLNCQLNK
jgi:glutamyl-tRNA synthetase